MSKKTIEQQVAELTIEQRMTVMAIGKKYRLSLLPVIVIAIMTVVVAAYFFVEAKQTSEAIDTAQYLMELNSKNYNFDDFYKYKEEAEDLIEKEEEYYKFASSAFLVGFIVLLAYFVCIILFYKSKYPYFTEGKYEYLKKLEKAQKQMQPTQNGYNTYQQYK